MGESSWTLRICRDCLETMVNPYSPKRFNCPNSRSFEYIPKAVQLFGPQNFGYLNTWIMCVWDYIRDMLTRTHVPSTCSASLYEHSCIRFHSNHVQISRDKRRLNGLPLSVDPYNMGHDILRYDLNPKP